MKTSFKKLFLLATLCFIPNLVHAESACSYSEQVEINNIVANVRANYEVVEIYNGKTTTMGSANGFEEEVDSYIKAFNIKIFNITPDVYVKISNDSNGNVATFNYADTEDGTATFQTSEKSKLITYTIEVFSNKYSCVGEMFRKFTITTPVYNHFSERYACKENPEFYYCQEFLTSENISINEFNEKFAQYKTQKEQEKREEEENKKFLYKLKEFYKEHAIVINSIGIVIVLVGVGATVILVKKKRSRVL